uniref:Uncharacterized protein n=1 Tax=Nelumbo nucifera TaxID=4432 RepID=A0A822YRS9_NELNU|nr:TPA_asm: hypothetical protein HUJ06_012606 [Nelumbo nucifera]
MDKKRGFPVARRAYGQKMRIPAAFATYDMCSQEGDGSMSYNVQAAFLSEGFLGGPNTPEGWNNMMKKAAKVWRKIWEENKEISEKEMERDSPDRSSYLRKNRSLLVSLELIFGGLGGAVFSEISRTPPLRSRPFSRLDRESAPTLACAQIKLEFLRLYPFSSLPYFPPLHFFILLPFLMWV